MGTGLSTQAKQLEINNYKGLRRKQFIKETKDTQHKQD